MSGFTHLPVDIFISLCHFLEPLDIISLGQTCSALRSGTRERPVWTAALRRSSTRNQILRATFHYQDMTMEQLQSAAMAPGRMLSKLCKRDTTLSIDTPEKLYRVPFESHRFISNSDVSQNRKPGIALGTFSRVCLVPGGRFLITFVQEVDAPVDPKDNESRLIVFELDAFNPPKIVAQIPYDDDSNFVICPSPNGSEIRIMMSRMGAGDHGLKEPADLTIFSVAISGVAGATTASVAKYSLDLTEDQCLFRQPYTLAGDLVVFAYHYAGKSVITVWNYIQNSYANWIIPNAYYREIFLEGQHVVMATPTEVVGWAIPPLHQHTGRVHVPMVFKDPPASFRTPLTSPDGVHDFTNCARLFDWYNTFDCLPCFDFIVEDSDHGHSTFITFARSDNPTADTRQEYQPQYLYHSQSKFQHSNAGYNSWDICISSSPYALCNELIVKTFAFQGQLVVATSAVGYGIDTSSSENDESIARLEIPNPDNFSLPDDTLCRRPFCFDPMSGRLAYVSNFYSALGEGGSGNGIVIVDYLKYPKST